MMVGEHCTCSALTLDLYRRACAGLMVAGASSTMPNSNGESAGRVEDGRAREDASETGLLKAAADGRKQWCFS